MNNLKAGFGRVCINPKMGIPIYGYYVPRYAEGILDDLEANVLALSANGKTMLIVSVDNCGIDKVILDVYRAEISKEADIPKENIIIAATHTHTGPSCRANTGNDMVEEYQKFLLEKLKEAVKIAISDLTDAKMGYGKGEAKNISFGRRYVMKDGSIKTNPGVNNPDIVKPLGYVDEEVSVLRFDRADGKQLIFANFATHPDVVGGSKISSDWPGLTRRIVEKAIDNSLCIFVNGAQGDVNHVNVHPTGGDFNGMFNDFDDVARGYDHARHMANVVAGGILQCFCKVNFIDVDEIVCKEKIISVPSNMPDPSQIEEAHRINDLHLAGRDSELPYSGMMLTTVVAEAARMVRLEHGPENFDLPITACKLGDVALVTIPGEGFTDIGVSLKKTEGFEMVIPVGLANGYEGYFPMQDSYDEGGYEARSSPFKAGVAERIIKEGQTIIKELL